MLFPRAINRSNSNVMAQTGYIDIFQGQFLLNLVSFFYLSLYYRSNAWKCFMRFGVTVQTEKIYIEISFSRGKSARYTYMKREITRWSDVFNSQIKQVAIMRPEFNAVTIKSLSVPEIRSEKDGETLKRELEQWKQESSKWLVRQPVARKRQRWCS